ncbi:MAG TPA: M3 family oligoendopeptidase [Actinomycetota bacterium]|nr:M3 family oligoendopeptidase [Actinomycetota bacterium]
MSTTITGAEDVVWNLSDLYPELGHLHSELDEALGAVKAFRDNYYGKVAGLDASGLLEAVTEAERIATLVYRAEAYSYMDFSMNTADPKRGALLQLVKEKNAAVSTETLFFNLEWIAVDDAQAKKLLEDPVLETYRHYLESQRRYKPYVLSEPEERIVTEKDVTGKSAWQRLFEENNATLRVQVEGHDEPDLSFEVAIALLQQPDRDLRRRAAEGVTEAVKNNIKVPTFIFNTVLQDKATSDRLRGYPHWLASRNLSNEASDESVQALIDAVVERYDIPQRYYKLKAKIMGLDSLPDWDRYAPLTQDSTSVPWSEAEKIIRDAYSSFSDEAGRIIGDFFDKKWIDAAPTKEKSSGAYCVTTLPGVHPYMMMSYTGDRRAVLVLAHELGHGLHGALASKHGLFNASAPITLAETASVFGEAITFQSLLEAEQDPHKRLDLLAGRIEDAIATSFRQVSLNRFEDSLHTARREEGELSAERIGELWENSQKAMFGDAIEMTEGYRTLWWSYISHFIHTPGYVYGYSFGYLFSLAIYNKYREEGDSMIEPYLELLRAGGSEKPENIASKVGIDLTDTGFWHRALKTMDEEVTEAEKLAATLYK